MALSVSQLKVQHADRTILDIDRCTFQRNHLSVIHGPSGAGKSTLLYALAAIDLQSGHLQLDDKKIAMSSEKNREYYRRHHVAFVFQDIHLLPGLSMLDNLLLPFTFSRHLSRKPHIEKAKTLLDSLGFSDAHLPVDRLSRGEQQRVAFARAVLSEPDILLADEPTASLDRDNAQRIIDQLRSMARAGSVVIATSHDSDLHAQADQLYKIEQGKLA